MYAVRIMVDGKIVDLKIFETLPDAQLRFRCGWAQAYDGDFDSIAIFRISDALNVRDAAVAVRSGDLARVELVDIQESREISISKLDIRIDL